MAPDASTKNRRHPHDGVVYTNDATMPDDADDDFVLVDPCNDVKADIDEYEIDPSLECVLQPRVLTDFSYIEQPVRCFLTCQGKRLSCNGKSAVFMATTNNTKNDEFALLPHPDDIEGSSMVIQNTQTRQYLCSSEGGPVYASQTHCDDLEKWTMVESTSEDFPGRYVISSVASQRVLAFSGNMIHTISLQDKDDDCKKKTTAAVNYHWKLDFTSGELCYLSLSLSSSSLGANKKPQQQQVRCNLMGELSLSKHFGGWEAWRFAEAGDGHVWISPWAHSELFLVSDDQGWVSCSTMEELAVKKKQNTDNADTTRSCIWSIEKAPNGLHGVLIKAVLPSTSTSGRERTRVLQYNPELGSFCTIPVDADTSSSSLFLDESSVFELESLHRQTYYLATADNCQRLDAARRGLSTRATFLPGRLTSEEWKIEPCSNNNQQQAGVVRLWNNARQQYLVSNAAGVVSLVSSTSSSSSSSLCPQLEDGSADWVLEEQEGGVLVVRSHKTQQVLVAPEKGPLATVPAGTMVYGNTRWRLEPKLPRQVSKEKLLGVGSALAIGIVGTVSTPLLISGAIGAIGISSIGVAGQVTIGSIRAVEAINTVTRVTLSSSQLMISQSSSSSFLSAAADVNNNKKGYDKVGANKNGKNKKNRPFAAWQSW